VAADFVEQEMITNYEYEGAELEIFQHAVCWKSYLAAQIGPYLRGDVLEAGAGIGANTRILCRAGVSSWTAFEPDAKLAESMRASFEQEPPPVAAEVVVGTLADLAAERRFDTVLYVDVMEHIEDDRSEVVRAMDRLRPDGRLIVLSPAHQWLFTEFDRAIGHYRRYSARSLREIIPAGLTEQRLVYLDSVGMLASAANRFLLKSGQPSLAQIRLWDSLMVRSSRVLDPFTFHRIGKSILGIWEKVVVGG
jgi:SAM-dependent methyltransferase